MPDTSSPLRKRGRPSAAERGERRDLILDVAVELLVEQGYARTTMDQIASRAQVTKRTIYTYYGDKPAVFAAAVQRLHGQVASTNPDIDSPTQGLADVAERIVRTLHGDEAVSLHRLVIAEGSQFPELAALFYQSGPQRYIRLLTQHLDPDHEDLAESLFTLLLGERHRKRLLGLLPPPSPADAAQQAHQAMEMLGLGGRTQVRRTRTSRAVPE